MIKKAVIQPQKSSTADDVDLDLGELAQFYALIPDGEYDVMLMNKKPHFINIFGSKRLVTYWLIHDPSSEYHETELILSFQCPEKGMKWSALSKFVQCHRIAVGRDPDRLEVGRLSPSVFKNKLFRALVHTVTEFNDPKSRKRVKRSSENHYSVIENLLALKKE